MNGKSLKKTDIVAIEELLKKKENIELECYIDENGKVKTTILVDGRIKPTLDGCIFDRVDRVGMLDSVVEFMLDNNLYIITLSHCTGGYASSGMSRDENNNFYSFKQSNGFEAFVNLERLVYKTI